jgi:Tfp pilus assembly protein PilN
MNFFQINLNKLEDKSKLVKLYRLQGVSLLVIALVAVLLACSYGFTYKKLHAKNTLFSERILNLRSQIEELEQGENYIDEETIVDLYDLTSNRIFWTEKFENLADIVGKDIRLTSIQYSKDKLYLRGITKVKNESSSFPTISKFIDRLKTTEVFTNDFDQIRFSSSEREPFMNREIIKFEVVCLRNNEQ